MKNFYIILFVFIFCIQTASAAMNSIEQELTNCLKDKYKSSDIIACSKNATEQLETELDTMLIKPEISNNQILWNNYKNSTQNSIITILNKELGSIYQEFSVSVNYNLNKNRLLILEYLHKKYNYKQEKYISEKLSNCLKSSGTDSLKTKCYIQEKNQYNKQQINLLQQLDNTMPSNQFKIIKQNQEKWSKYKNSTLYLINHSATLSDLQKAQITKLIYEERNSQLQAIKQIFIN